MLYKTVERVFSTFWLLCIELQWGGQGWPGVSFLKLTVIEPNRTRKPTIQFELN